MIPLLVTFIVVKEDGEHSHPYSLNWATFEREVLL